MATATLRAAVLALSEDTGRTLSVLKSLGHLEREAFLTTLRPLNIARWAVILHRLASDGYGDDFAPDDVRHARSLARNLLLEVA